ncbi:hypothetical protein SETIT_4G202300v2 [Setaria italica]|uniref:Uncharacterized protein n=1 Tax=Setaria italica TaxID=4555 RepID=A0A368QW68_SETIT|nr:hypothetical protein SETIT_4G202300v2 [Setaria italica]
MVVQRHTAASSSTSPSSTGQHLFTTGSPSPTCTRPPSRSTHAPSFSESAGQVGDDGVVGVEGGGGGHGVTGGPVTGGVVDGGPVIGGTVTGGPVIGGTVTGGPVIGGYVTGGPTTGGVVGGPVTGGRVTGGPTTGGRVTGGATTGGRVTGPLGGPTTGGREGPLGGLGFLGLVLGGCDGLGALGLSQSQSTSWSAAAAGSERMGVTAVESSSSSVKRNGGSFLPLAAMAAGRGRAGGCRQRGGGGSVDGGGGTGAEEPKKRERRRRRWTMARLEDGGRELEDGGGGTGIGAGEKLEDGDRELEVVAWNKTGEKGEVAAWVQESWRMAAQAWRSWRPAAAAQAGGQRGLEALQYTPVHHASWEVVRRWSGPAGRATDRPTLPFVVVRGEARRRRVPSSSAGARDHPHDEIPAGARIQPDTLVGGGDRPSTRVIRLSWSLLCARVRRWEATDDAHAAASRSAAMYHAHALHLRPAPPYPSRRRRIDPASVRRVWAGRADWTWPCATREPGGRPGPARHTLSGQLSSSGHGHR